MKLPDYVTEDLFKELERRGVSRTPELDQLEG